MTTCKYNIFDNIGFYWVLSSYQRYCWHFTNFSLFCELDFWRWRSCSLLNFKALIIYSTSRCCWSWLLKFFVTTMFEWFSLLIRALDIAFCFHHNSCNEDDRTRQEAQRSRDECSIATLKMSVCCCWWVSFNEYMNIIMKVKPSVKLFSNVQTAISIEHWAGQ